MSIADDGNLESIGKGFPEEVAAFRLFRDERGWWEAVEKRWEAGER